MHAASPQFMAHLQFMYVLTMYAVLTLARV